MDLELFLASLRVQVFQDFELIAVDQNPDERLFPLLAPHAERFPIHHLRTLAGGVSQARNAGLQHAGGDVLAFPDDDCRYPPDLLRRAAEFFAKHPEIGGLAGRLVDEEDDSFLMSQTRCGISAKQLERELDVTYKTAWRMANKIRSLLQDDNDEPLSGTVKMDETYVGGRRRGTKRGRPGKDSHKTPVFGMVER